MYFVDMNNEIVSSQNFIYVLQHFSSRHLYVGQTARGMKRPRTHFLESVLEATKKHARSKWIRALRARGFEPEITILEELESADGLDEAECFHIAYLRAQGFSLLNHTDGGGGIRGYRFSENAKQACSERNKKRYEDPAERELARERMNQRIAADPNYRANMSEAMKKRAAEDPNYSEKMSAVSLSQWTEETRQKKSIEMLGNKNSSTPKARAAASAANKGKPKSAEAKARMSEAKRQRWKDPEYRARQIAAQKKAHGTPEKRAQAAEWAKMASHDTHRSPEYREKMSEILTKAETPERTAQRSEIAKRLYQEAQQRRERERKEAAIAEFDRQLQDWNYVVKTFINPEGAQV